MMVLIDTTVWIDFFAGRQLPHVAALERLIMHREDLCICGIILTEVLQGIRRKNEFRKTKELFRSKVFAIQRTGQSMRACQASSRSRDMTETKSCLTTRGPWT